MGGLIQFESDWMNHVSGLMSEIKYRIMKSKWFEFHYKIFTTNRFIANQTINSNAIEIDLQSESEALPSGAEVGADVVDVIVVLGICMVISCEELQSGSEKWHSQRSWSGEQSAHTEY